MNICIIGKNSYIGNHIDKWLSARGHEVFQLDVLTEDWYSFDYSEYDVVIQVAGIVHRPDCNDVALYKRVNTDMPIEIANYLKEVILNVRHSFFSVRWLYLVSLSVCLKM